MDEFSFLPFGRAGIVKKAPKHVLASQYFLARLKQMKNRDTMFFSAQSEKEMKKIETRLRVRLWRYAEYGHIQYREYSVWRVEGGVTVLKNLDPNDNHEKRNIKRRDAGEVDRARLESEKGLTALVGSNPTPSENNFLPRAEP
jgi:hypothetical protein